MTTMTLTEEPRIATMHTLVHTNFTAIGQSWQRPMAKRVATASPQDALRLRAIANGLTMGVVTIMSVGIALLVLAFSLVDKKSVAAMLTLES